MTIFHTSPHNGQAERCRARNICPYGATYGTSILRDGTTKTGTGGSTWTVMKNPPQRAEERIVIDSDGTAKNIWDVENRKLRTSTNTSAATDTATAIEESSPMIEKDSRKPVESAETGTHDINVESNDTYTVTIYDGEKRLDIQMVDGYPTQHTIEKVNHYRDHNASRRFALSIWTASPDDYAALNDFTVDEAIEDHYGKDLFYLLDEETATGVSEDIAERANYEVSNDAQKNLSADEAKKFLDSWKKTEGTNTYPEDFTLSTRPFDLYTPEHVMKLWKQHSWENNRED